MEACRIKDTITKEIVSKEYKYANRKRARARAEKLNLEYGSYRYYVQIKINKEWI